MQEQTLNNVRIHIYCHGVGILGEPTESRLRKLPSIIRTLHTVREDAGEFVFVNCRIEGEQVTVAIRFAKDKKTRISCLRLRKWDPNHSLVLSASKK